MGDGNFQAMCHLPFLRHPATWPALPIPMISEVSRSLLLALVVLPSCHAAIYHLDAAAEHDLGDGLTPDTAWKSLDQFNATVFKPGDRILFKSGQKWVGQ